MLTVASIGTLFQDIKDSAAPTYCCEAVLSGAAKDFGMLKLRTMCSADSFLLFISSTRHPKQYDKL